jgi:hypothetical protein
VDEVIRIKIKYTDLLLNSQDGSFRRMDNLYE